MLKESNDDFRYRHKFIEINIYMILNINRKIILVIAFLSAATSLASSSSVALASFDYSGTAIQESFSVLVTVAGVEGNCGEELKIMVAYKSDIFELCEGDERPSEKQIADPISSEGHELYFKKDRSQWENHLMFVSKSQVDSQIVRF